ncbi:dienelactone hydrolase [Paenibacillus sp. PastF-3]|uniref:dienelactone hydrolase family protein n=1 Tax=unclassified Paenibacillus TaxID=185978 RepID=UPI000BA07207|nr:MULTISPECIES: prolyl oligopeptidase family serine peptidase [unclassified Paenibacillus]MDH6370436.1 dienelactone hydrolase [Paenibacillus sp. PastF-3]OZQ85930.1 hydrolase [Paenibacillus sp. VTT E-133291]
MEPDKLKELLGDLPADKPIAVTVMNQEERDGYSLESLLLDLNGIEQVPAYVAIPLHKEGPFPLVVFNHSHGGNYANGRNEFIRSSPYLQQPSFAKALTELGYAACCIDMWGFNERGGKTESELVKEMLWQGQVMWGMMLYDNIRMIDYMGQRKDIDAARIATVGMSMGGLMAWWLAALDERVGVIVDICSQVDAHTLMAVRGLDHHGYYSYVPGLLKHFTTLDIQKRIVPRPRMSLVGRNDRLCPTEGVELLDRGLSEAYQTAGKSEHWQPVISSGGHMETVEMRTLWQKFLTKHL